MGGKGKKGNKGNPKGRNRSPVPFAGTEFGSPATFLEDGADEAAKTRMKVAAGKTMSYDVPGAVGGGASRKARAQPGLAGPGDVLNTLIDQPVRKEAHKGSSQSHWAAKAGTALVVEATNTDAEGVHRAQVTSTDKKGHTHTGWVRQNDGHHKYFELMMPYAGVVDPGPGYQNGHGNHMAWDAATLTITKDIVTRKGPTGKAGHAFKLKSGAQALCSGTALDPAGVEYAHVRGPIGARKQHTGWLPLKPNTATIEGGPPGLGDVSSLPAGLAASAASEGVPPASKKKGVPKPPKPLKKMNKKERKAWEASEVKRKEEEAVEKAAAAKKEEDSVAAHL